MSTDGTGRRVAAILVAVVVGAALVWWAISPRPADLTYVGLAPIVITAEGERPDGPDPSTRELTVHWQSDDCVDPDSARVNVAETAEYVALKVVVAGCPWWRLPRQGENLRHPIQVFHAVTVQLEAPLGDRRTYVAGEGLPIGP